MTNAEVYVAPFDFNNADSQLAREAFKDEEVKEAAHELIETMEDCKLDNAIDLAHFLQLQVLLNGRGVDGIVALGGRLIILNERYKAIGKETERDFVLYHEIGHLVVSSTTYRWDEHRVEAFACIMMGYPPSEVLESLKRVA